MRKEIIHLLGGSVPEDFNHYEIETDVINDNVFAAKLYLAHVIGEYMLENDDIRFEYNKENQTVKVFFNTK